MPPPGAALVIEGQGRGGGHLRRRAGQAARRHLPHRGDRWRRHGVRRVDRFPLKIFYIRAACDRRLSARRLRSRRLSFGVSEEAKPLTTLDSGTRARLPDSSFAYVDSTGKRRLPIHDASHVRNALARFDQTSFEDDEARERARQRLLRAAKKYGIVPLGFFDGQLRKERSQGEIEARATDVRHLPRGTVTFLFTDIEGSTGLVRQLGDAYAGVLRRVRTIIRASVRKEGGHEVDARADEFFAVFRQQDPALKAALDIQRCLPKRAWPGRADVRVRIGIHTGRPKLTENGYIGIAVHTAARVCWASNGGPIFLTAAAARGNGRAAARGTLRGAGRRPPPRLPAPQAPFHGVAPGPRGSLPSPPPASRSSAASATL